MSQDKLCDDDGARVSDAACVRDPRPAVLPVLPGVL